MRTSGQPRSGEDHQALRAEVIILGLFAGSFVLFPGPLSTVFGDALAPWLALAFVGLWFLYAIKVQTGRRTI